MKGFKALIVACMLLCGYVDISAQASSGFRLDTLVRCQIFFRHDRSTVDSTYRDNQSSLSKIREALSSVASDSPSAISSIVVEGSASPIGPEEYNYRLSLRRAQTAEAFLRTVPGLEEFDIQVVAKGEDWTTFKEDIKRTYWRKNRHALLKIMDAAITDVEKERRIKKMDGGITWSNLAGYHMRTSRHSVTAVVIKKSRIVDTMPELAPISAKAFTADRPLASKYVDTDSQTYSDGQRTSIAQTRSVAQRTPVASVRTNLLVPVLNVGVEVPVGNRWSVAADYYYPWIWPSKDNQNCFELLGWSAEGRYWFGRNRADSQRLKGHSLGVYMAGGYYDFERGYRGMQGEFLSPGLDYTYSFAIGRAKRVHLQLTLALGYIRSWGRTYNVFEPGGALYPDDGILIWDYFGPTKVAVSIVVPFYKREGRR